MNIIFFCYSLIHFTFSRFVLKKKNKSYESNKYLSTICTALYLEDLLTSELSTKLTHAVVKEEAVFRSSFYFFIVVLLLATKSTGCQMNIAEAEVNCLRGGIQKCKYFILQSRFSYKTIN